MIAKERIWFNADKSKVVPEGSPEAAFLYAAEGHTIPDEAAARFGIKDGRIGSAKAPAKKESKPEGDKESKPAGDKAAKPDEASAKSGGLTINKRKKG